MRTAADTARHHQQIRGMTRKIAGKQRASPAEPRPGSTRRARTHEVQKGENDKRRKRNNQRAPKTQHRFGYSSVRWRTKIQRFESPREANARDFCSVSDGYDLLLPDRRRWTRFLPCAGISLQHVLPDSRQKYIRSFVSVK